jgi:hypothetical protein
MRILRSDMKGCLESRKWIVRSQQYRTCSLDDETASRLQNDDRGAHQEGDLSL